MARVNFAHVWWAAAAFLLIAVTLFPAVDLTISNTFYEAGAGFSWRSHPIGLAIKKYAPLAILAGFVFCLLLWLIGFLRRRVMWRLNAWAIGYLTATLLVGPGIIVESLLKPYSGRARPDELTVFGGHATYTPPLWPADACVGNCSFVSGHAAIAFWLTSYAFLMPDPWRARWLTASVMTGAAMGLMRIMQGAHFASDIVYAGVIVVLINVLFARLLLPAENKQSHGARTAE